MTGYNFINPQDGLILYDLSVLTPGLARFLEQDVNEEGCVVYCRSALGSGNAYTRSIRPSSDSGRAANTYTRAIRPSVPILRLTASLHVGDAGITVRSDVPRTKFKFTKSRRRHNTPEQERPNMRGRGPVRPEHLDRAYRVLICQVIVANFMIYGSERHQLKLSSRAGGGNKQVGQGENSARTTDGISLVTTGFRKRAPESSGPGQGNSDLGHSEPGGSGADRNRKRQRLTKQKLRLYACPFYRADPQNIDYARGGRYERCGTRGIKTDKLKEHIRRTHTKPAQCKICRCRGDPGVIRHHIQSIKCTPNDDIEIVDTETKLQDNMLTLQRHSSWHQVFRILFPSLPTPSEGAQYFHSECGHSSQRLEQNLATHLEQAATVLEMLHRSREYREIVASDIEPASDLESPAITAAAARLVAIISSGLFAVDPPTSVPQPPTVLGQTVRLSSGLDAAPATHIAEPDRSPTAQLDSTALTHLTPDVPNASSPDAGQYRAGGNNTMSNQSGAGEIADPLSQPIPDDFWETFDWDTFIDRGLFDPADPQD